MANFSQSFGRICVIAVKAGHLSKYWQKQWSKRYNYISIWMAEVIVVIGATGIYLFEDRANIPSLQHSMWLAIVTMTSVGYGDYFPESIGGYVVVSVLTFVSVLFLALPAARISSRREKRRA